MYKKIRAFICLVLMLSAILTPSAAAYATENTHEYPDGVPEYAEMHEVVIEIPANNIEKRSDVKTYNAPIKTVGPGGKTNITSIASTERNISFLTYAKVENGTQYGTYSVSLEKSGSSVLSVTGTINGTYHKSGDRAIDGSTYLFVLSNHSSSTITVYVTYYLWS